MMEKEEQVNPGSRAKRDGWHRPVAVPSDLDCMTGSVTGPVQLPLRVYPSGRGSARVFDLDNDAERIELYQVVLAAGRADDICRYLNREELCRLWPRLWLPSHVRAAWGPKLGLATS